MRIMGILAFFGLFAAFGIQSVYLFKTRGQVEELSSQIQQMAAETPQEDLGSRERSAPAFDRPLSDLAAADSHDRPAQRRQASAPPPRFVTAPQPTPSPTNASDPLPMPAGLESAEAREQLRQFVLAQLKREREEERERQRQRREEEDRRRLDETAKKLGLNANESQRFAEVIASNQASRQELRRKIEAGEIQRADMGREFQTLRERNEGELRKVLGDSRLAQYQQIQQQERRNNQGQGWRGGPGGPGGGEPGGRPPGL